MSKRLELTDERCMKLRQLARAAMIFPGDNDEPWWESDAIRDDLGATQQEADFIAETIPQTVLALLDERDELRRDGELLGAIRLIDEARASGLLTLVMIVKHDTEEGREALLNAAGVICGGVNMHDPQHAMTECIMGTAADIRAHMAATAQVCQ